MTKLFTVICHKLKPTDLLKVSRQGKERTEREKVEGEGRMRRCLRLFACFYGGV